MINLLDSSLATYRHEITRFDQFLYLLKCGVAPEDLDFTIDGRKSTRDFRYHIPSKNRETMYIIFATKGASYRDIAIAEGIATAEDFEKTLKEQGLAGVDPRKVNFLGQDETGKPVDFNWDHVMVKLYDMHGNPLGRCPYNEEMQEVHQLFFKKGENTMQFHPRQSEYINVDSDTLHIWRHAIHGIPEPMIEGASKEQSELITSSTGNKLLITFREDNCWQCASFKLAERNELPSRYPIWSEACDVKKHLFPAETPAFSFTMPDEYRRTSSFEIDIWCQKEGQLLMPHPNLVNYTPKKGK